MTDIKKKKLALPAKMAIGMILGAITGFIVGPPISSIYFVGEVFIKLLRMCIYPLILLSIISGVSAVADMNRLKKVGSKFFWYWLISGLSIGLVGMGVSLLMNPGKGIDMTEGGIYEAAEVNILANFLKWIPDNPFSSLATGNLLQIIVIALVFGIILASFKESKEGRVLVELVNAGNVWIGRVIEWVLKLAPYGVFAIIANMTATLGITVIGGIFKMLLTMYIIFAIVFLVIYPLILLVFCKASPIQFYKNIYPALIMAFSTCSSAATIPFTMQVSKERNGVPEDIVNLITAPAATLNMHAVCLQIPLYAIFASQIYGIQLGPTQLLMTIGLGLISAMGAAGVPGGGFVMVALMLEIMGLPLTVIPWIIGIYYLIDMPGTTTNIAGDTVGMVYVASRFDELDMEVFKKTNSEFKLSSKKTTVETTV